MRMRRPATAAAAAADAHPSMSASAQPCYVWVSFVARVASSADYSDDRSFSYESRDALWCPVRTLNAKNRANTKQLELVSAAIVISKNDYMSIRR